uniref:Thioredoxin domain-containing protein n=1 Tax=Alexandrium catenella TaxID=2925 RepID=A0A7S1RXC5_ALECA
MDAGIRSLRAWPHGRMPHGRSRSPMACSVLIAIAIASLVASLTPISAGLNLKSVTDPLGAALEAVFPTPERGTAPHLIGFYAEQSMEAKRMKYLGDLLEKELPGTKIVWLEAWQNPMNERLRATIDLRNQCGGVPYLFNRKTGKVLCGVVAYDKLRLWAQGLGGDARIYRDIGGGN